MLLEAELHDPASHQVSFPEGDGGNCYRPTRELSRSNELLDAFRDGPPQLEPLQEYILQDGQYFCPSAHNELLQGRRDT